jgi:hypothetical protein
VSGAEATAVEALTVAGTRICSVLCPDCVRVLAAGKYPGVSMSEDGKLEAVPSVPAANTCSPKFVGEFGHCNDGPTQNRPYLPEKMKKACAEILANTRRDGPSFLACSDERTADAIREAMGARAPEPPFTVGEPVVDAETGKVTVDVGLRSPFPVMAQLGPPGRLGRSHQDQLIDNTDARIQAPRDLAQEVYGFFQAGGSRIYVDGPGVGTPATAASEAPCCEACSEFESEMRAEQARALERKAEREYQFRERLADYAHEAWAEWMRHWEVKAIKIDYTVERFGLRWRREDRERWVRLMDTPYAMLTEAEKASDREQADKILAILRGEGA